MPATLGTIKGSIQDWIDGETIPDRRFNSAINNAIESLWSSIINFNVGLMMHGPVSLDLTTGTEGIYLVSIIDPTVALTVSEALSQDPARAQETLDISYTYVTESGTETMLGPVTTHTLSVPGRIAAVHPPQIVDGAFGWNLYARDTSSVGNLVLQNDAPLPFLTTSSEYQNEPESGWLNDPSLPQPPIENTTGDDICYIRHLECQMPDLGWKSYDAADVDSLMMRKVARFVSSGSQYQNYSWDLINQRQLEIRPALGTDLTPRYFYVKRPRRLRYDNSPLPFLTVPATAFLEAYASSRLLLSIREFESAQAWGLIAEQERQTCLKVVLDMNRPKMVSITPFN